MSLHPRRTNHISSQSPPAPPGGNAKRVNISRDIPGWLFSDNPGISISGAPGSGKSNTLEILLREVVKSHLQPGLLFIDPHGTSAKKFYRWCLAQGPSVAHRVLYLHFADTRKIPSIDVLHVPGNDVGSIAWFGRLAVITELVSKILLAAWGETDFNSKPILFRNVFRVTYTLAYAGLSLADSELFVNVADPVYTTMCRAVPDVIPSARTDMEDLASLRPADLMAQLDSYKNRTIGLLSNPVVKAVLSRTAADGAITMQQVYDDRRIVIVNLETGGVLRSMDQEILANVLLTLAIFTAMNNPQERRHLQVLAVDELPVFKSSADLLTNIALPQCRKYLVRTIACFQGTNAFPDRTEDRLLNAFLGLCGTRLYFRHNSEADCTFFGRTIAMPVYSPMNIKYSHAQPMQFQEGHDLVELIDRSSTLSDSDSEGESEATGVTDSDTLSDSTSVSGTNTHGESRDRDIFREIVSEARASTAGQQTGKSKSRGMSHQDTRSRSRTRGRSFGVTRKQQLVPIIRVKNIITNVTFFSKEELDAMAATTISNLQTGEAILHFSGSPPLRVLFPYAADPFVRTPRFGAKKELQHGLILERSPAFATIEQIQEQRRRLIDALLQRLVSLAHGDADHPRQLILLEDQESSDVSSDRF